MPSRLTKTCLKIVAAAFTSLVAPLTVHVVESDLKAQGDAVAKPTAIVSQTACYGGPGVARGPARPAPSAFVVGDGTGKSPDEALRNAGLAAVRKVLTAEVDPATMALRGSAVMESIRFETRGIIGSWRELSARREWRLSGIRYHSEVAVEVNRNALRERVWGLTPIQPARFGARSGPMSAHGDDPEIADRMPPGGHSERVLARGASEHEPATNHSGGSSSATGPFRMK